MGKQEMDSPGEILNPDARYDDTANTLRCFMKERWLKADLNEQVSLQADLLIQSKFQQWQSILIKLLKIDF